MLYLLLSFFLLPALAATLKVRKRKLMQTGVAANSSDLFDNSNSVANAARAVTSRFGGKLIVLDSKDKSHSNLYSRLNLLALQTMAFRQFNFTVVGQAQLTAIFYV